MSTLASNARWLALAQVARVVLQLLSLTILARLLSPQVYGVMAMAWAVSNFASLFRDMGMSAAIVQKEQLTEETTHSVFWLTCCMGTALGLLMMASAWPVSYLMKEDQLLMVLILISLNMPISAAAAVHQALMERNSRFRELAYIEVGAQAAGLATAIAAAMVGWGVYSLVAQAFVVTVLSSGFIMRRSGWMPSGPINLTGARALLGFGGNLLGFNLINYFSRNADTFILGRVLGAAVLGAYSVGYKLMLFPITSVTWVANRALFPVMSRQQSSMAEMQLSYLKAVAFVSTITFPLMAGLWVLREPFVLFVFGEQWRDVIGVIAWLAPVGMIQSVGSTTGAVFMARGRTDILMRLGAFSATTQVLAFVVGAQYGLTVFTALYLAANLVNIVPTMLVTLRLLNARPAVLLESLTPALSCSGLMVATIWLMNSLMPALPAHRSIDLVASTALGAIVYLGSLFVLFRPHFTANVIQAVPERVRSRFSG